MAAAAAAASWWWRWGRMLPCHIWRPSICFPSASFEPSVQRGPLGATCAEQEVAGSRRLVLPVGGVGNPEPAPMIRLDSLPSEAVFPSVSFTLSASQ